MNLPDGVQNHKLHQLKMADNSKLYAVLKHLTGFIHNLFYRRIFIEGTENIPTDKPVIFAPNHQNALMDPLAILYTTPFQTFFLARADIFKRPLLQKIFTFFKMLPVYRMRDGIKSLDKNDETFSRSVEILKRGNKLTLFPEAQHNNKHFLLPLKKGIPRIAFLAAKTHGFDIDLQIIPVGIHYSNYYRFKSDLWVTYGKPIALVDFETAFETNENDAHNLLRERIAESIKPLMLNITSIEEYRTFETAIAITNEAPKGSKNQLLTAQQTVRKIDALTPDLRKKLVDLTTRFETIAARYNANTISLSAAVGGKSRVSTIINTIMGFPFFIVGFMSAFLPFVLSNQRCKKLKDKQFSSTIKFGFWLPLLPLINGIIAFLILPLLFTVNFYISAALFFLMFYLASYSLAWINMAGNLLKHASLLLRLKRIDFEEAAQINNLILATVNEADL
jgi:1-acyl-sn-glycerol-3-phosphate acyltransferase